MQPLHRLDGYAEPGAPVNPHHYVRRSTLLADTITALGASVICLFTAEVIERPLPVTARLLRSVPLLIAIVWLSRRFLGGSSSSSMVYIHHNNPPPPRRWINFPFFTRGRSVNVSVQPRLNNVEARNPVVFVPARARSPERVSHVGRAVFASNPQVLVQSPPPARLNNVSPRHTPASFIPSAIPVVQAAGASVPHFAPALPPVASAALHSSQSSSHFISSLNPRMYPEVAQQAPRLNNVAPRAAPPILAPARPPVSSAAAPAELFAPSLPAVHSRGVTPPSRPAVQPRAQAYAPALPSVSSAAASSSFSSSVSRSPSHMPAARPAIASAASKFKPVGTR